MNEPELVYSSKQKGKPDKFFFSVVEMIFYYYLSCTPGVLFRFRLIAMSSLAK